MRLSNVDTGHRLQHKLVLGLIHVWSGVKASDIMRMMLYRPEFFGAPAFTLSQAVMRGPSDWSAGERELFAAFTSNLNQCRF